EAVNAQCAEILRSRYPGLKIAGRRNGYFGRDEEAALCEEINRSGADIVFVGLGVPLEYAFCARNKRRLHAGWMVTCGGCYNFVTGAYRRAPQWMQKYSLEWLYRMVREPRRLFWRYAVTNPAAIFFLVTRTA
ncbi:MAG TPA: WecB/TagA/CpsF family glycosyltransferase, partial [Rhizomicrobium sp.]|nr:WecB/TagA/CpsF family glycosyltransferase [Rhizomicrobium sp.]